MTCINNCITQSVFYYFYLVNDDLYDHIKCQSTLYLKQTDINNLFNITNTELKQYVGICLFTSIVQIPNVRRYWSTDIGFTPIKIVMSIRRFKQIRRFIYFNDNTSTYHKDHKLHDRLHKIRPLI